MRVVVIYEGAFDDTEPVARAIWHGLSGYVQAELSEVSQDVAVADADLLVLGGSTRTVGRSTRSDGRQDGTGMTSSATLREWLSARSSLPLRIAAFDTKTRRARWLPGAGKEAASRLRRHGVDLVARPQSFFVAGVGGPPLPGELARAEQWGAQLGALASARAAVAAR